MLAFLPSACSLQPPLPLCFYCSQGAAALHQLRALLAAVSGAPAAGGSGSAAGAVRLAGRPLEVAMPQPQPALQQGHPPMLPLDQPAAELLAARALLGQDMGDLASSTDSAPDGWMPTREALSRLLFSLAG